MVVARVTVLGLLVLFLAAALWRHSLWRAAQTLEVRWSQQLYQPSAARREAFRKQLTLAGCRLSHQGQETRVIFEGSPQAYIGVVNLALQKPLAWEAWSLQSLSPSEIKASITLSPL